MSSGGHEEEGGGHSVGLWYVSFSDKITLLLSFFVMLTTFSSYSKESIEKFKGYWAYIANYSIFPGHATDDSVMPEERITDRTVEGSEQPTDGIDNTTNPRQSFWTASPGAYADQKVIYISSSRLFWGDGSTLTAAGKQHLKTLGGFISLLPCHVMIGQSLPAGWHCDNSLERAGVLAEFLQQQSGCPMDCISISSPGSEAANRIGQEPVIEIILLSKGVLE